MEILKVKDLVVNYGMIKAVKGASFCVNQGEIVALIGANGAGKTSILHTVTGLLSAKEGSIEFDGKDITKSKAHDIVKLGMAHVPEGRRVFGDLTVIENLKLGAYIRNDKAGIEESLEKIYKRFPRLFERKTQIAGTLSGGEQQMLAVGRALMSSPELLFLDEPSLGLAPNIVLLIFDMIKEIQKQGVTILLVEQNANLALQTSNRAYVLENGLITMQGDAREIANNPKVKEAYLGIG